MIPTFTKRELVEMLAGDVCQNVPESMKQKVIDKSINRDIFLIEDDLKRAIGCKRLERVGTKYQIKY